MQLAEYIKRFYTIYDCIVETHQNLYNIPYLLSGTALQLMREKKISLLSI